MKSQILAACIAVIGGLLRATAFDASSFASRVDFPAGSGQVNVAFGDLDGDGKPDAVIGNYFGNTVSVYRNTGTSGVVNASSFASPVNFTVGSRPLQVQLADLDGDGKLDIVSVNELGGTVSLLRNTATIGTLDSASFAATLDLVTAGDSRATALADFDGDGKLDIAVACFSSGALSIFQNNCTSGSFSFGARVDIASSAPSGSVGAGDIDGDGKADLVLANAYVPTISVYRNGSGGGAITIASFAAPVQFATGSGSTITLGDVDGDGKIDIVTPNQSADTLSVLRNTGTPGVIDSNSLAPQVNFSCSGYPYSAAIADLDGDGKPEIAVANSSARTISVFKNLSTSGSFDHDSLAARFNYGTGDGARALTIADVDGDGLLDLATGNLSQNSFSVLRQGPAGPPPPPPPPPGTNSAPGLVSLWHADGDAQDALGNNHGSLVGSVGFASGVSGQAFVLNGSSFIRVPDSATLYLTNELSFELWFKREGSLPSGYTLYDKRDWTRCSYGASLPAYGLVQYYLDPAYSDFQKLIRPLPSTEAWHHFAATYRQTGDGVEMVAYVDGLAVGTIMAQGTLAAAATTVPLAIGAARDGGSDYFQGLIDEVAIYNYALSASQVASNFSAVTLPPPPPPPPPPTPVLVSLWHADGDAQDALGNNHGSLVGGVGFAAGVSGQAFVLDGASFIRVPDSATLYLTNELSFELWFKREGSLPSGYTLYDKRDWTRCSYGASLPAYGLVQYYLDPAYPDFQKLILPLPSTEDWHHFTATYRQTAAGVQMVTYVDGAALGTNMTPGSLAAAATGVPLAIGAARDGGSDYFKGLIDEVAIYNYALSASQVASNFSAVTLPPPGAPQITTQPMSQSVVLGGNTAFSVTATGGGLSYQWLFQGDPLSGGTSATLAINGATLADVGEYAVIVSNGGGAVTSLVAVLEVRVDDSMFAARVDFAAQSGQAGIALGDLDGDGKPDAVVANYSSGSLSIYRNTSTAGSIDASSFAPRVNFAVANTPIQVLLVDLDGDGKLDIVCVNQNGDEISVLRNTATSGAIDASSFAPKQALATAAQPYWISSGDLNGDGKPDLIVSCYNSGALSVYQNSSSTGTLSFEPRVDLGFDAASASVQAGDIDGDGHVDIVVASTSPFIWVYRNVGGGGTLTTASFAARVAFPCGLGASVTLADVDGDGKLDLITPNSSENTVSVLRNTSTPGGIDANSFAPRISFPTGNYPYRAVAGDLDGDGRLDLVMANSSSHTISVFRNLSSPGAFTSGSLASRVDYPTGLGPRISAIADIDGDGLPDIANANLSQSSWSVLRQSGVVTNIPPHAPVIVQQPVPYQSVSVGGSVQLNVIASGTGPLSFQWFLNDAPRPGADAALLVLNNAQSTNAGSYRVVVSNLVGSVTSIVAVINVASNAPSGGTLLFANSFSNRVYDVGGSNFVAAGGSLVVGLWAGADADSLQLSGALATFNTSFAPGRFNGGARTIPGTSAGQIVSLQVRVWDSADGATYEEAIAAGGKRGASTVFQLALGGGLQPPAMLWPMPSFALTLPGVSASPLAAPAPQPASVKLTGIIHSADGWTLTLQGSASATCAIEASTDLIHWTTIAYVVNERGIVEYTDTDTSAPARFYRVQVISN